MPGKRYIITGKGIEKARKKLLFTAFTRLSWEAATILRFLAGRPKTGASIEEIARSVVRQERRYRAYRPTYFRQFINELIRKGYAKEL